MKLRNKFRILMIGIVSVPAITATLLVVMIVVFSQESANVRQLVDQRLWINEQLIPRLETENFDDLVAPPGALVFVFEPVDEVVRFSTIPNLTKGDRFGDMTGPPDFDGPRDNDFTFFLETVTNSDGKAFRIAQAFPIALQREIFSRARNATLVLSVFLGMVFLGAIGGNLAIRSFQRKLGTIRAGIRRIASGDLGVAIEVGGSDELSDLASDLETTRQELREERAKRSRFLMSVSHDLKTPLTTIRGYLEAIDDGFAEDPETLARYLEVIHVKSEILESRILELIEFVRMETGEWRMQNSAIPLYGFLETMCSTFAAEALVHGRTFTYALDFAQSLLINGDRELLVRVFENLFHNALRYTKDGDRITLHGEYNADGSAVIRLEDTGPGFGDNDPETLFEPLARGTNSRSEPGFGLGLATVRAIVESHRWSIYAQNGAAGGACFSIFVPATELTTRS